MQQKAAKELVALEGGDAVSMRLRVLAALGENYCVDSTVSRSAGYCSPLCRRSKVGKMLARTDHTRTARQVAKMLETLYAITAVASAGAAILAWLAKLRWSREFSAAKEAQIAAKQAEIASLEREVAVLRELTPMRVREYFLSVKEQLEEYNDRLRWERDAAVAALQEKERETEMLKRRGDDALAALSELDGLKLGRVAAVLERHMLDIASRRVAASEITLEVISRLPRLEPNVVRELHRVLEMARDAVLDADQRKLLEDSIMQTLRDRPAGTVPDQIALSAEPDAVQDGTSLS